MNILMLHDVRPFDPNFFPERYKQHSYLTDQEFLRGVNSIHRYILNPTCLFSSVKQTNENYILTFDDGLKDHLWVAEVLAEKKISAIFFIPFGVLKEKSFINSHLIQFLIASGSKNEIANYIYNYLDAQGVPRNLIESFKISRWKNNLWTTEEVFITRVLREALDGTTRAHLLYELINEFLNINLSALHRNLYLTFEDLNHISDLGHIIGSHGYYSMDLRFEDESVINNELTKPIKYLERFNTCNHMISYANGGYNTTIASATRKAGYRYGFGTKSEVFHKITDPYHLPRLDGTKLNIFT